MSLRSSHRHFYRFDGLALFGSWLLFACETCFDTRAVRRADFWPTH